ncbi:hypothetical protein DNFV4_02405 [Nitrospira tepida]|uniref:Uncharacterized protein n=1 Tax=Nitrospira tepida TaxID=2973512 RepID=A0AA86T5G0_9BACT|nr:hypothetical protein [Nitrospira tepida]CAI4031982.1 hypothetical protein DNFV4_02405 [Nitrospira tepida]
MQSGPASRLAILLSLALLLTMPLHPSIGVAQSFSIEPHAAAPSRLPLGLSPWEQNLIVRIPAANGSTSVRLPLMDETGERVIGAKVCAAEPPLLMAEGSNGCEIISCGMGIKQTCKITCPAGQTPKCSCDCERSFGPICTDYKANCRCE